MCNMQERQEILQNVSPINGTPILQNSPLSNLGNGERIPAPNFSQPPPSTNQLRPRTPVSPDPSILIGNQGNQGQPLHGYPFTPAVGLNVRPEHHQSAPPGSQVRQPQHINARPQHQQSAPPGNQLHHPQHMNALPQMSLIYDQLHGLNKRNL